ncbi:MAG: pyruvoyl-dependent arginine decarboxylase [Flavisolibacter sp.]
MAIIPSKFFFTKGTGIHEKELTAFEEALRDAGVHTCNFIKTSSIIPPGCSQITKEEGIRLLNPGQITFAVMAETMTNEPGQLVTAGIGMAQPKDETVHGFLAEAEGIIGRTPDDVEQDVIEMAIENLIAQKNPKFDGQTVFRKGKKNYSIEGQDILVDSVVESAQGAENNRFTVVVALAVFIYDN